ncbi:MAG: sulfotransferase [Steroidobacteraceae bacterium]
MILNIPTSISSLSMRQAPLVGWRILLNGLGLRKGQKVFAVGFAKCATTSLHALFLSLGLPSYHGKKWRSCDNLRLLRTFDCFSDGIPKDMAKLDELFPGSKFVLQVRDLQSWVYSRLGHIERSKKRGKHRVLPDWDTTDYAVRAWILMRNRHHLFVQEYFSDRPHDLLIVNFVSDPSAGTRVANFLGFPGNFDRPLENVNPHKQTPAAHVEMLRRNAAELCIPAQELKYDIYCPSLLEAGSRPRFPFDSRAQSELQKPSVRSDNSAVA